MPLNLVFFDDWSWRSLLPLTFTRPVCEIRIGILTIREKWLKYLNHGYSYLTQKYLSEKYSLYLEKDNLFINGSILPDNTIVKALLQLNKEEVLLKDNIIIGARTGCKDITIENCQEIFKEFSSEKFNYRIIKIEKLYDIFRKNGEAIMRDFEQITYGRRTKDISKTNNIIGSVRNIFIEPGAKVEYISLNSSTGVIYIGCDSEIMEGSLIRGPFAMCNNSVVKLGAKIYGPTTLGPYTKVGGELNNVVFIGYSNKAHDGFLGNSVIGQWCNLGADTNNSNLKNNYGNVKLWDYNKERFEDTGLQFCGLIMADHSKCGINTMFNTGTVVGVSANIFGAGYPRNFIPSFSWGGAQGFTTYRLDKALEVAQRVMKRRNITFTEQDKKILSFVFEYTKKYRNY